MGALAAKPEKVIVIVSPYPPLVGVRVILDEIVKETCAELPDVSEALTVCGPRPLVGAAKVTVMVPVADAVVVTMGVVEFSHVIETGAPGANPFPVTAICVPTGPPVGVIAIFAEIVKLAVAECCSASETVTV
jgi:hypothetical protein